MRNEQGLTKQAVVSELTKSPHGKLEEYIPVGTKAVQEDPEFFAHLIAWNAQHGQVKDAKMALPVLALTDASEPVFVENAAAHLAALDPRLFVRALDFSRQVHVPRRMLRRLVARYLYDRQKDPKVFDAVVAQHRKSIKTLYSKYHVPVEDDRVRAILWDRDAIIRGKHGSGHRLFPAARFSAHVRGGVLTAIRQLSTMPPQMAADAIVKFRIPFLIVKAKLGDKLKEPDLLLALVKQMSPAELVTEMKLLEKLGVRNQPATRAALEEALSKLTTSKKSPTLKTSRAADVLAQTDKTLEKKLRVAQEAQMNRLGNIEGDWAILGDKSSSMRQSIVMATEIAAVLARSVKGKVHLVFFDSMPRYIDATGKTYEELKRLTATIRPNGMTSIGAGLAYLHEKGIVVNGIAVVTDGGENTSPFFARVYPQYAAKYNVDPPVYLFEVGGDPNSFVDNCERTGIAVQTLLSREQIVDYYSLPNLVMTMRAERYALVDDILATPLKRLDEVLTRTTTMEVLKHAYDHSTA